MNKQLLTAAAVVLALLTGMLMVSLAGKTQKALPKQTAIQSNKSTTPQPQIAEPKSESDQKLGIRARIIIPSNQIKATVKIKR